MRSALSCAASPLRTARSAAGKVTFIQSLFPLLREGGEVACLIKPQFEAGRDRVGKKGVVRDAQVHLDVVKEILSFIDQDMQWTARDLSFSPIKGPEGNIEFLMHVRKCVQPEGLPQRTIEAVVSKAHESL